MFMYIVCVGVSFILWLFFRYRRMTLLKRHGIPGPKPNLILGNTIDFMSKGSIKCLSEWTQTYGPIVGFYLGGTPNVVVADPELLKLIQVKDFKFFIDKPEIVKGTPHPTNCGQATLFWTKGNKWKELRTILNPTFSASKLKQTVYGMKTEIDILIDKIAKVSQSGSKEINVFPIFQEFALNIIINNALGVQVDGQVKDHPLYTCAREAATFRMSIGIVLSVIFPELGFILYPLRRMITGLLDYLKLTPESYLNDFCLKVLETRRKSHARQDLLQNLMETRLTSKDINDQNLAMTYEQMHDTKGPTESQSNIVFRKLTDLEIIANSILFIEAGYETTSTTLSYVIHHLVNYPHVQEKMREEAKNLLEKEQQLDYNTVNGLAYMEAVIMETLRLYPPAAPFTMRCPSIDYKYSGITIPKGTCIFVGVYQMHRNPDFWDQPNTFNPNRFLDQNKSKVKPIVWQPFGFGPRNCIGMRFAMLQIKLCLAHLLLKYKFECGPNTESGQIKVTYSMAYMFPSNGVNIKVTPIKYN